MDWDSFKWGFLYGAGGVFALVVVVVIMLPALGPFMKARMSGVQIGLGTIVFMKVRGTNPSFIVGQLISLRQAGLPIEGLCASMESAYLVRKRREDIETVVEAMVRLVARGENPEFNVLRQRHLAGEDIFADDGASGNG